MNLDGLGQQAQADQACAAAAQFATWTAAYYRALRRDGVPPSVAAALTLQWQGAQLAKLLGGGGYD